MSKAAKLISEAIAGIDGIMVFVNDKGYFVKPPTIHNISGAVSCISKLDIEDKDTLKDIFLSNKDCTEYANALSYMIKGDTSISEELQKGTYEEVIDALSSAFEMISAAPFLRAVSLTRSANLLTAKAK